MQSLNVVFHVGLNKLLTKPAYDVTVMDDLALGGASLLSAHYVPVYLKQLHQPRLWFITGGYLVKR